MNTNRDIVHLVHTRIKENNGDRYLSTRATLFELIAQRNLLVKQEKDKRRLKDIDSIYTNIPCLEMEAVPLAQCCSYSSPCTIRKSKYPIPKIGESIWGYIIEGVWSIDGTRRFDPGSASRYANLLDLSDKKPNMFWIQNGYLYISDPDIELIKVRAFLEDLEFDPRLFKCSEEFENMECMNPLDLPFRCPGYLIRHVVSMTVQELMGAPKQIQEDKTDNDTQVPN